MKARMLICILLVAIAVFALAGCGSPAPGEGDTTVAESETDAPATVTSFPLVQNGVAARIVYPLEGSGTEVTVADTLAKHIEKLTGILPRVEDDYLRAGNSYDSQTPEILVGFTGYEESRQVYDELDYGASVIRVVGNKLVIAGIDMDSLLAKLVVACKKAQTEDNDILLDPSWQASVAGPEVLKGLPYVPTTGTVKVLNSDEGCYQLTFSEKFTAEAYQAYQDSLLAAGFTLYATNTVGGNTFHFYTNATLAVSTAFTSNRYMTVLSEPLANTDLTLLKQENNTYQKPQVPMESTLTMLGLLDSHDVDSKGYLTAGTVNGMSFIIRLEDGSFIINDGGHNTEWNADRLYTVLRQQAPDPENIVIAAWFLSHAHGDHSPIVDAFGSKYASKVTVEHFIFNFPHADMTAKADCGDSKPEIMSALDSYFASVPRTKAHAGQVFYIRNAKVTMLNTLELQQAVTDIYCMGAGKWYYNDCSLNYIVEIEEKRVLILGDAGSTACSVLRTLYTADDLKCDIVQASHHGVNGADESLYKLVAPEYAMIPVGGEKIYYTQVWIDIRTHKIGGISVNGYLFEHCGDEKVYLAEDNVTVFLLKKSGISVTAYDTVDAYLANQSIGQ